MSVCVCVCVCICLIHTHTNTRTQTRTNAHTHKDTHTHTHTHARTNTRLHTQTHTQTQTHTHTHTYTHTHTRTHTQKHTHTDTHTLTHARSPPGLVPGGYTAPCPLISNRFRSRFVSGYHRHPDRCTQRSGVDRTSTTSCYGYLRRQPWTVMYLSFLEGLYMSSDAGLWSNETIEQHTRHNQNGGS